MLPDWRLNLQPLVYEMMLQPTEPPSQDWYVHLMGTIFRGTNLPFFLSEGWNVDLMAGFGAAALDLEVETDEEGRVTV